MPNWVRNVINVYGKKEDVADFVEKHIKGTTFDFDTIIPEPRTREECDPLFVLSDEEEKAILEQNKRLRKEGFGEVFDCDDETAWFDWYQWRIHNWGTKWNAKIPQFINADAIREYDGEYVEILIAFDTAWVEPIPIFAKLHEIYKDSDLSIYYEHYSFENWEIGHYTNDYDDEENDCPIKNLNYEIGRRIE